MNQKTVMPFYVFTWIAIRVAQVLVLFPGAVLAAGIAIVLLCEQQTFTSTTLAVLQHAEALVRPATPGHVSVKVCAEPPSGMDWPPRQCQNYLDQQLTLVEASQSAASLLTRIYLLSVLLSVLALFAAKPTLRQMLNLPHPDFGLAPTA